MSAANAGAAMDAAASTSAVRIGFMSLPSWLRATSYMRGSGGSVCCRTMAVENGGKVRRRIRVVRRTLVLLAFGFAFSFARAFGFRLAPARRSLFALRWRRHRRRLRVLVIQERDLRQRRFTGRVGIRPLLLTHVAALTATKVRLLRSRRRYPHRILKHGNVVEPAQIFLVGHIVAGLVVVSGRATSRRGYWGRWRVLHTMSGAVAPSAKLNTIVAAPRPGAP